MRAAPAGRAAPALPECGIEAPEGWNPQIGLPPEAAAQRWSRLERDLFLQSGGAYHPGERARARRLPVGAPVHSTGAALEVTGRVSVVSPTICSRQRWHGRLWACFDAQTWPDKELVVVETYANEPSPFLHEKAAKDPRIVIVSIPVSPEEDFSVGLKRDMTLHLATGEYVVNFDDDDIYSASYVGEMVAELQRRSLVGLALSSWMNYYEGGGVCGYSDPHDGEDFDESDPNLYGFSFVHRRREAIAMPYPNLDFGEDAPLLLRFRRVLGDASVGLVQDTRGLCMHVVHRGSTSIDPGFVRDLPPEEIEELEVFGLPVFRAYLDAQSSLWSRLLALLRCGA